MITSEKDADRMSTTQPESYKSKERMIKMEAKKPVSQCIANLCYPDIEEHLKTNDLIVIPIGSIEQHSRHLPLSTDMIFPEEIAKRACEKTNTLYTPIMPFGYSPHHLGYVGKGTGTVTLRPQTIMSVYYDLARSMIHHGYNKIIFVTQHASNLKIMDPVLRKIRYDTGAFCCCLKTYVERYLGMFKDILEGPAEETPGWHSGESETSYMLYLAPEYCRMDRAEKETAHKPAFLPDAFMKYDGAPDIGFEGYEYFNMSLEHREFTTTGCMGNPHRATKEKGEIMVQRMSDHLASAIEELRTMDVKVHTREYTCRADW